MCYYPGRRISRLLNDFLFHAGVLFYFAMLGSLVDFQLVAGSEYWYSDVNTQSLPDDYGPGKLCILTNYD